MTKEEYEFLDQKTWFHATTYERCLNIRKGVNASINELSPTDFGSGFYLCADWDWCVNYAKNVFNVWGYPDGRKDAKMLTPVIIEREIHPLKLIEDGFSYRWFQSHTKEFADFVLFNRLGELPTKFHEDMVAGPMADADQIAEVEKIRLKERDDVSRVHALLLKENSEPFQLLLHSQRSCDMLKEIKVYTTEREVIEVDENNRVR